MGRDVVMSGRTAAMPGADPMTPQRVTVAFYLAITVIGVGVSILEAATHAQNGRFAWPVAQWALTTPLGIVTVVLGGGLLWGVSLLVPGRWRHVFADGADGVDVTDLSPAAWPPTPIPPWQRPGGPTRADYWFGRDERQRSRNVLALVLAGVLVFAVVAMCGIAGWYGLARIPDCAPYHCPPSYWPLSWGMMGVGCLVLFLAQYAWVRHVERRCGIRFRVRDRARGGFQWYIRQPGVTREAATAALASYARRTARPMALRALIGVLALVPFCVLQIGLMLFVVWLPELWTPS